MGLVFFAPLLMVIAILIKLESRGPILYTPLMIGLHGKEFLLFRFRTLTVEKSQINIEQRLMRSGRFIRNYSLDHFPMLINLLKGDLTLVGPRPMEVDVVNLQDPVWQRYFQVKPGLFNYAVLKLGKFWTATRETNPTLNQDLELEYIQRRSMLSDVKLFLQSIKAFILSGGNIKARSEPDADMKHKMDNQSQ